MGDGSGPEAQGLRGSGAQGLSLPAQSGHAVHRHAAPRLLCKAGEGLRG